MKAGAWSFAFGRAVDQYVLMTRRQLFKGRLEVNLVAIGGQMNQLEQVLRGGTGTEAIQQRLRPIGDYLCRVKIVKRA